MVGVNYAAYWIQKLPQPTRTLILNGIYGLSAGGSAVAFHLAIHAVYLLTFVRLAKQSFPIFMAGSFLVIISTSLAVGWLLNSFCVDARGSGIPQLKLAFWKDFGVVKWRVVWVKFVAGVLSVGGGCSLGREGPSVQLAGGLASNVAGLLGEPKQNRRNASAAGAAAGLAAAFNTPLAAITFVLEEIVGDLNSRFLGAVLLASVLGALVAHGILGEQPAFSLGYVGDLSWLVYLAIPVVAATASLVGVGFQRLTLGLRMRRKDFERFPGWLRPAIGGLITWVVGCAVFYYTDRLGVFSLGYQDLSAGLTNALDWRIAGILLVTKLIATVCCYGFGGCGGIFSPTLFFGGMTGVFLGGVLGIFIPLESSDHILLAVVGMSSCLGAVVRVPITGILIVFEMTHEFSLAPALILATLISQWISRRINSNNFYEALLLQDGHNLEHVIPPRNLESWQQLPISSIANFQPVVAESLEVDELRPLIKGSPYQFFPVALDGQVAGVLSRREAEEALAEGRPVKLEPATVCVPTQTIRRLQFLLLESTTGLVVLMDKPGGKILGLVTLHDLVRAEVSITKDET